MVSIVFRAIEKEPRKQIDSLLRSNKLLLFLAIVQIE